MAETRRDLFKTSVLGGLGLVSASALAACTTTGGGGGHGPTATTTDPDAVNWSVGMSNGANPNCYVFQYVPGPAGSKGTCNAWAGKNPSNPPKPPLPSSTHLPIDVQTWYNLNRLAFDKAQPTTVTFGAGANLATVKIDSVGGVSAPPDVLKPGHVTVYSWNEVGEPPE